MYKAMLDKKNFGKFFQTKNSKGPQYVAMRESENQIMQVEEEKNYKGEIVVMYFGAGRGPLIRRALSAAKKAGVYDQVKVIALDKNPNAIVTLRNMIIDEQLEDKVTLFSGDMRKINVKEL